MRVLQYHFPNKFCILLFLIALVINVITFIFLSQKTISKISAMTTNVLSPYFSFLKTFNAFWKLSVCVCVCVYAKLTLSEFED